MIRYKHKVINIIP